MKDTWPFPYLLHLEALLTSGITQVVCAQALLLERGPCQRADSPRNCRVPKTSFSKGRRIELLCEQHHDYLLHHSPGHVFLVARQVYLLLAFHLGPSLLVTHSVAAVQVFIYGAFTYAHTGPFINTTRV